MPQLIPVAAYYVATWYGYGTLYAAAAAAVASYATNRYQTLSAERQARNEFNAAQKDRMTSVSLVDAPRSRIYGRVRNVDGILFKGTYGTKKEYLQLVVALAAHEVDAIETVYFGDVALTLDGNGYVGNKPWNVAGRESFTATVGLDGSGNGTYNLDPSYQLLAASVKAFSTVPDASGSYSVPVPTSVTGNTVTVSGGPSLAGSSVFLVFQGDASASKARVQKFTGAPGQDLSPYLQANFPTLIQSEKHRFEGIACLLVTLQYDQDAFPQGIPQISAVMRGAKVYDRRTGLTAWTQNPSTIGDDWARYSAGGAAAEDELDTTSFIAAANACDVSHVFKTRNQDGTLFETTRPMYACGIALDTTADASVNFAAIVESMAGQWAWSGGRLRVRAGAYSAPVASIDESWCSGEGDIEIVGTLPRAERVNVMTPTIYNSAASYTQAPQAAVPAAAYIDLDGEELPQEVTFEGVTDVDHASHICGVMMREARQALTVKLPCKFKAYPLEVFDVVSVTLPRFGWSGKAFEVLATEMTMTGGVVLTLKETDASIFDPDAEFTREDPAPNTALPEPFSVPTLSIASIQSGTNQLLKQSDGTIVTRMLVTWAAVQDEAVRNGGAVEVIARRIGTDEIIREVVFGTETQAYIAGLKDGTAYAVTIRARNKLIAGLWSVLQTHVVAGKSQPPSVVSGLSASVIPGAVHITWDQCPDVDYDLTRLRYGASWAAGTELPFKRPGTSYDWPWPAAASYTIWAAHVDTSGNLGAPVSFGPFDVTASALAADTEWDKIAGQTTFRIVARGNNASASAPIDSGVYRQGSRVALYARSYNLAVIRRSDGQLAGAMQSFDVYGDPTKAAALAAALNALTPDYIAVVYTHDEPHESRLNDGLPDAMYRCGASRAVFGSSQFQYRSAYVLIGIPGCGEGNGAEAYQGDIGGDPDAWVDVAFQVVGGNLVGVTSNYTPRSLQDYGYTGDLAATRNKVFKQDGDPASGGGDVQNGDRWLQTTSGVVTAIYDRIGGAWVNGPTGPKGDAGESVYVATVYLQSSSAPSAPSGGSYNFSTGVFVPPAGWSASQPATTTTPTYVAEYPFSTTTPSVTVPGGTWTTPVVDAVAGGSGTNGGSVFTVEIYLQTGAGAPSAPTGGSYTFSTDSLTPPSGWTRNKPASSTTPTYRCGYTFSTTTPATPVTAGTWSTPVVVAQNGADGVDAVVMTLSASSATLQADVNGVVSDFSPGTTTAKIMKGSTDDSANWTFTRSNGSGVTSSLGGTNNQTLTVTAMTGDTGYVDISASRTGYGSQTVRFSLAKAKSAKPVAGVVEAIAHYVEAEVTSPANPVATLRVNSTGKWEDGTDWYFGGTPPSGLYVRVDIITVSASGSTSGTYGAWLACSGSPSWSLTRTTVGAAFAFVSIAFASDSAGANVLASGTGQLAAIKDAP